MCPLERNSPQLWENPPITLRTRRWAKHPNIPPGAQILRGQDFWKGLLIWENIPGKNPHNSSSVHGQICAKTFVKLPETFPLKSGRKRGALTKTPGLFGRKNYPKNTRAGGRGPHESIKTRGAGGVQHIFRGRQKFFFGRSLSSKKISRYSPDNSSVCVCWTKRSLLVFIKRKKNILFFGRAAPYTPHGDFNSCIKRGGLFSPL